jgi:hypothetical protein
MTGSSEMNQIARAFYEINSFISLEKMPKKKEKQQMVFFNYLELH